MLSTVRALVLLLALLACLVAGPGVGLGSRPAHAAPTPTPGPVVVVGTPGLTWEDVGPTTPRLAALAAAGGTAALVVRTVHETTCPVDGWLTLGAGARATAPAGPCTAPAFPVAPPAPKGARPTGPPTVRAWPTYTSATRDAMSGAHLASLGTALAPTGSCVATVGPGAALTTADPAGLVPVWKGPFSPAAVRAGVAQCGVTVIDIGAVRAGPTRAAQVAALDARLGQALDAAGPGASIVAVSLADDGATPRLRPLVVRAPKYDGRVLSSPSTRQPGLVLLTDVAPTVAALRGLPADEAWTGEAVTAGGPVPAGERLAAHRDLDLVGRTVHPLVAPLVIGWVVVQLLLYGAAWAAARAGLLDRPTASRAGAVVATTAAAWPAATFLARLVPWWRTGAPGLVLALVTLALAAAGAALAWAGPWRRHPLGPPAVVALLTIAVLVLDLATGSRMSISSLIGEHPTVGGRFYGLGNASSGLLAAATLLVMTAIVERGDELRRAHSAALLALALGLAVVAVTAAPRLGADFGGPAALLPAVAYLTLRGLGLRLDAGRVLVLGVLTTGVLLVVCLLDWLRPAAERTHLGRFTESVVSGRGGDVIGRKLIQNWHIFTSSPWTMAIPVVVVTLAYAVWRPRRVPGRPFVPTFAALPVLRVGLLAIFLMLGIAMLVNDSGATVPAPVGMLVVPLVIATMLLAPLTWGTGRGATRRVTAQGARGSAATEPSASPTTAG